MKRYEIELSLFFWLVYMIHYTRPLKLVFFQPLDGERDPESPPTLINAFQLIGMSSCLDLSGFFEKEVRVILGRDQLL